MRGWLYSTRQAIPIPFPSTVATSLSSKTLVFHYLPRVRTPRTTRFTTLAAKNDDKKNGGEEIKEGESDGGDAKNGRWILDGVRWRDLVLSPDPDNLVAVGLTGLLTWASVQVLWQLLFISLAILVAAVKYSLIAALLIFILITLL